MKPVTNTADLSSVVQFDPPRAIDHMSLIAYARLPSDADKKASQKLFVSALDLLTKKFGAPASKTGYTNVLWKSSSFGGENRMTLTLTGPAHREGMAIWLTDLGDIDLS